MAGLSTTLLSLLAWHLDDIVKACRDATCPAQVPGVLATATLLLRDVAMPVRWADLKKTPGCSSVEIPMIAWELMASSEAEHASERSAELNSPKQIFAALGSVVAALGWRVMTPLIAVKG